MDQQSSGNSSAPVFYTPPSDLNSVVGSGFKAAFSSPVSAAPAAPTPSPQIPSVQTPPTSANNSSQGGSETAVMMNTAEVKGTKSGGKKVGGSVIVGMVLVLLLAGLVAGFGQIRSFVSSAQGSCLPENLKEANLEANSVVIVFETGKACQMEVAYGTSKDALLLQVPEAMASLNHRIRLAPLLASTTYYYQVVAEGKKVGEIRSFLTKAAEPTLAPSLVPTPPEESTLAPEVPGATDSGATSTTKYTLEDFQSNFGSANSKFDIDKNGVVNSRDWLLYQKQ